ncbi:hypothetical protein HJC23_001651 [Cyclotella cryptica]|uniref:Aminoglycoside phosphotransferase domain-containing protein n=1 Tax=Cyclotella cryptica TaxID=29204 RepID=A0ABD3QK00_9STRA|eukprot:CCRYP_004699-RA/>CCRYP_004699-RA protein AED:0.00 eAED:0.00 QI:332/1/1/1/1/1/2/442/471
MKDTPDELLHILAHALPTVVSYHHLDNIVQGNAEGTRILARHSSSISEAEHSVTHDVEGPSEAGPPVDWDETELFLKRVSASAYVHKSWKDMRRTLLYLRTEVRFYNEIVPLLLGEDVTNEECSSSTLRSMIPTCHHAEYDLKGLVDEDSPATDVNAPCPVSEEELPRHLDGKGGYILLQSLSPSHGYYQRSPITTQESILCLEAVARLHASASGNVSLLQEISNRLSNAGGSYHLKFRNPKELQNIVSSWQSFRENFVGLEETRILEKTSVVALGQRVYDMAEYVSNELTPGVQDEYATLVHGDYKAMNVFLPTNGITENSNKNAIMIDFSCVGIGYGMSDVAMHIVHAVLPSDLEHGNEQYLVEQYLCALEDAVNLKHCKTAGGNECHHRWTFPRDIAWRQYQLACIDYLRFIMGRFWQSAMLETFEKKKSSKNTTLINRDVKAAMAFIEKVDRYLELFEDEKKEGVEK